MSTAVDHDGRRINSQRLAGSQPDAHNDVILPSLRRVYGILHIRSAAAQAVGRHIGIGGHTLDIHATAHGDTGTAGVLRRALQRSIGVQAGVRFRFHADKVYIFPHLFGQGQAVPEKEVVQIGPAVPPIIAARLAACPWAGAW